MHGLDAGATTAPASVGQRLLWMLAHHRGGDLALNCPVIFELHGRLDVDAFDAALADLVRRHETLRTTFTGQGTRLTQVIGDRGKAPLRLVDLRAEPDPYAAARAAMSVELVTPLELESGLTRTTLWRWADEKYLVCLNVHHLATDAASCPVLFRELGHFYERHRGCSTAGDLEAPPSYVEFSRWQNDQLDNGSLSGSVDYWRSALAGAAMPQLPWQEYNGPRRSTRHVADIAPDVASRLGEVARSTGSTAFAVLLALYYLQLKQNTGTGDVTVASLFANRRAQDAAGVGFFANMLLLRTKVPRLGTFADLVAATHRTVVGAFRHQGVPYHLVPSRGVMSSRADEVVFQVIAEPVHGMDMADLRAEALVPEELGSRFDFELVLVPNSDGGYRVILFTVEGRLSAAFCEEFLFGYVSLAGRAARSPRFPLDAVGG